MAKKSYIGIGSTARKAKKQYAGVDGVARKVTRAYVGVNGKAQRCFDLRTMNVSGVSASTTMEAVYDGAYGNGVYVLVSIGGYYWRSTNGKNWSRYSYAGLNYGLEFVCFGNGFFVCLCYDDYGYYALRSTDGLNWSRTFTFSGIITFVSFGNGLFIAGGEDANGKAIIYTSTNGSDFTLAYTSETIGRVNAAAYLPGVGFSAGKLFSADGKTWVDVPGGIDTAYGMLRAGRDQFVGSNWANIYTSKDGLNWVSAKSQPMILRIEYLDGVYVASGYSSKAYYSYDGSVYETIDLSGTIGSGKHIMAIFHDGSKFYLAGQESSTIATIEFTES